MSSKIGLLFSLVFFMMFFLLAMDVMCIQYHYSDLDAQSVVIGYEIAHLESIDDESITVIEEKHQVTIKSISNREPEFGDVIDYTITRYYKPLIVTQEAMEIAVNRSVVIGYY